MLLANGLELYFHPLFAYNADRAVVAYDGTTVNAFTGYYYNYTTYYFGPFFANKGAPTDWSRAGIATLYRASNGSRVFWGNSDSTSDPGMHSGVIFGDGNTAPALSDYCLSGNQFTDFWAATAVSSRIVDGHLEYEGTYILNNTGANDFTIREMALTRAAGSSSPSKYVLVTRDVLDTPIVIPAGDTKTVTYKLTLN